MNQLSVIYACKYRWFSKIVCMWFWCLLEMWVRYVCVSVCISVWLAWGMKIRKWRFDMSSSNKGGGVTRICPTYIVFWYSYHNIFMSINVYVYFSYMSVYKYKCQWNKQGLDMSPTEKWFCLTKLSKTAFEYMIKWMMIFFLSFSGESQIYKTYMQRM